MFVALYTHVRIRLPMRELFMNVSGAQTRYKAVRITPLFTHDTSGGYLGMLPDTQFRRFPSWSAFRSGSKAEMDQVQDQGR